MVQYSQDLPEIYQNFNAMEGVEESEVARLGSSVTLAEKEGATIILEC